MKLFKRKPYTVVVTFSDNTETRHKDVDKHWFADNLLIFMKWGNQYMLNMDHVYGIAIVKESK